MIKTRTYTYYTHNMYSMYIRFFFAGDIHKVFEDTAQGYAQNMSGRVYVICSFRSERFVLFNEM